MRPFKQNNNSAQAIMGEYVLIFFIVLGMIVGMSVYFRRALQARIYDAHNSLGSEVFYRVNAAYNALNEEFNGSIYIEYEPYYVNTESIVSRDTSEKRELGAGPTAGIFTKTTKEKTDALTVSVTLPPKDAVPQDEAVE